MAALVKRLSGKITLLAAVALSVALALGITPALALDKGNVSDDGTASITVHKYKTQSASSVPGTGESNQSLPFGAEPLSGVTFMLFRLDTAKVEGAAPGVAAVVNAPTQDGVTSFLTTYRDISFPSVTHTTGVDGTATFGSLKLGYYLLVETNAGGANVDTAIPSIVTVPYAEQASGGTTVYNKDVHVYPKNVSREEVEKTLVPDSSMKYPASAAPGDILQYQIAFKIPDAGKVYTTDDDSMSGMIIDKLPLNAAGQPVLAIQEDYEVIALPVKGEGTVLPASGVAFSDTSGTNQQVTWTLTPALAKAVEAINTTNVSNSEKQIVKIAIRINAKVNDNAYHAGYDNNGQPCIVNTAQVVVFDSTGLAFIQGKQCSAPAVPVIGFPLTKVDADNKPITSDSATFKIASSYQNAVDGTYLVNGATSNELIATTNVADGKVVVSGLASANVKSNNAPYLAVSQAVTAATANLGVPQTIELWLVETQAPNGYRILQAPQKVTLQIVKPAANASITSTVVGGPLSIVNTMNGQQGSGNFALPNTGGIGAIVFVVAGVALVAFAIASFTRSRRHEKNESSER